MWLLEKEWRELLASRAWWVMLVLIGPLVGVSFISAVRTYAELSGLNGTAAGVGEAFSPLVGVWAPTFSACELAAAFLLPFVAIRARRRRPAERRAEARAAAADAGARARRGQGAGPAGRLADRDRCRRSSRSLLWRSYGGSVYPPELATRRCRPRAQRRADDRARVGRGVAHRTSVDGGDPDAERDGRHVDRQFHRARCTAACGSAPPATRRPPWSPSSSTGSCGSTSCSSRCALIAAGLLLAAIWMRLGVAGQAARVRIGRPSARSPRRRSSRARSSTASWDCLGEPRELVPASRRGRRSRAFASRCASRRTWRPRIRGASISSATRCRSCVA